jgi:hypothetical protein
MVGGGFLTAMEPSRQCSRSIAAFPLLTERSRFAIVGAHIHFPHGTGTHAGRFAALLAVSRIGETYRELVRKGRLSPVCEELLKDASRAQRTGTASPVSDRNRRGADVCQECGLQVST